MDLRLRGYDKIVALVQKGVDIPNPLSLDVGEEVSVDRISGHGVTLYPGCRIYGKKTVISAGVKLGEEAPVTVDNCWLGPEVELKGGYFKQSVFLKKSSMGSGAHVREACLLEEEANGAHTVGLKQTILLPFVTLGSLINFCDCLMAGGTSRKDHSEVGSSYIHFNFTPDGNKTTASLFGDVPRGVMLNQPRIFLGGQGGAVGPLRVGFGTVVSAGSILREDVLEDGQLVVVAPHPGRKREFVPHAYVRLDRIVRNNIVYLANLVALEQWYTHVRRRFFEAEELGPAVYEGALETLKAAKEERIKRLKAMVEKVGTANAARQQLIQRIGDVVPLFTEEQALSTTGQRFVAELESCRADSADYVETIQGLPQETRNLGVTWLQGVVDGLCDQAGGLLDMLDRLATK